MCAGGVLIDSGRESILEVGREERARERGGQRGHHGFFWWDGERGGRVSGVEGAINAGAAPGHRGAEVLQRSWELLLARRRPSVIA